MNTNTAPSILPFLPDCDLATLVPAPMAVLPADNDTCPDKDPAPALPEMRPIPDPRAEGLYATIDGQIVRLRGDKVVPLAAYWAWTNGRVKSCRYLRVDVAQPDGSRWRPRVHSLIALAWLGPRPPGAVLRHLDDNRANNRPDNLAHGTQGENMTDPARIAAGAVKLTPEIVRLLRETHARIGGPARAAVEAVEAAYGPLPCSHSAAEAATLGRTWAHLPMPAASEDVPESDVTPATLPTGGLSHAASAVPAWVA